MNEKLKKLRLISGLSQLELANALGISKQSVINYESGKSHPKLSVLIEICRFFNVSADYLIGTNLKKDIFFD